MKKLFRKIADRINRFFALIVINLFKGVFAKYPEGVQVSFTCFKEIYRSYPEFRKYVKFMYKEIAEKELVLTTTLQPIKKGTDKYFIIVCKDRGLKTVFSLKRHGSDGEIKEIEPSNRLNTY